MSAAKKNPKHVLFETLKRGILTMDLRPGSDLDEAKLCDVFNLSRTPLREVFRELAGEGYIELRENRGARVSEMTHVTLHGFFTAAPMIYSAVLQLAAKNATAAQVAELVDAQDHFRTTLKNPDGAERALANNRFHEVTGEMAHNIYLLPSFKRLLIDHARIGMTFYQPQDAEMEGNLDRASEQHDAIIRAIEMRDEAAAAKLAIDHWKLSRDQIELYVMPSGLDVSLGDLPKMARG